MKKNQVNTLDHNFVQLLNSISDSAMIISQEGIVLVVNNAFTRLVGFNARRITGKHLKEITFLDDKTKIFVQAQLEKRINRKPVKNYEITITTKTGSIFVEPRGNRIQYAGKPADLVIFHDVTENKQAQVIDITDRKKLEQNLQDEKLRYHALFKKAPVGVLVVDPETLSFVEFNDVAYQQLGYTKEEFSKLTVPDIEAKESLDETKAHAVEMIAIGGGEFETKHKMKNGEIRNVVVMTTNLELSGKKFLHCIFYDVTDVRKVFRALKESETKYRHLVELSHEGIWALNSDYVTVFVNPRMAQMLGYCESEMIGKSLFDFLAAEDHNVVESYLKMQKQGVEGSYEYTFVRKDGALIDVSIGSSPLKDDQGNFFGNLAVVSDITERKRNDKAIKETEIRFRQLFNTMPSGVAVYQAVSGGEDFVFADFNQTAEKIEGVKKEDILGKLLTEVFPGVQEFGLFKVLQRVFQSGKTEFFPSAAYKNKTGTVSYRENWVYKLPNNNIVAVYNDVTDRKNAEEALRESEKKYRGLINGMNDTAWVIGLDGKFLDVNEAAVKTLGYSREELLKMGPTDIDNSLTEEQIKELVGNMPTDSTQVFYTAHNTKDGKTIPVEISSSIVFYKGKQAILSIARNITERKQMEMALKQSEERFRQVAENSGEWIWEVNPKGLYTYASPIAKKMLGYTPEELIGKKHFYDLFSPEEKEQLKRTALGAFSEKQPFRDFVNRNVRKDGSLVWLSTSGTPMIDENGKLRGYRGADTDITERKKLEEELRDSEEKFRTISQSVRDAITLVDFDGIVKYWNPAAEKIFGYLKEEAVGKRVIELIVPEKMIKEVEHVFRMELELFRRTGRRAFFNGDVEWIGKRRNGSEFPLKLSLSPIKLGEAWHVVGVLKDITERKQNEQIAKEYALKLEKVLQARTIELNAAHEKLLKLERFAAIGELAGMVGHDLRNPLTGIRNAAYFLEKKADSISETQSKEMFGTINRCIEYSNKIVNDLLDYSREVQLQQRQINPKRLISEALMMAAVPERVQVVNGMTEGWQIDADENKLKRVFINIIRNAVDAMPNGGKIFIDNKVEGDKINISVTDTGTGIPEDVLPKLFSPLFTTKAQGMGFGLAICKRIIEAHRGTINVTTARDKGTTFIITLPVEPKIEVEDEKVFANMPESLTVTTNKT